VEAAKPLIALIGAVVCAGGAAAQPAALPSGAWAGTAQLTGGGGPDAFPISIEVRGRRATVSLGRRLAA
jgi:hypothetical protein